jgi:hypothetical protein
MSSDSQQQIEKYIDDEYKNLPVKERKEIYDLYFSPETIKETKEKLEKIIFYKKPPTPEEFLDPVNGWVPKDTPDTMFSSVREQFLKILKDNPSKQIIIEYGATRIGKTHLVLHLLEYTIMFFHHLREPALYYGKSSLADLAIYIISFDYDKTKELYLRPLFKILGKSRKFKQVKFQDQVEVEQKKVGRDIIVYSKAATTGQLTLASGLQLQMGNDDALAFVGANIFCAFVSEISFWLDVAGATEERIYRLYTDLRGRIKATVGEQYLSYLFLDTSANVTDSLIEEHILKELRYREYVLFRWQTRWEANPKDAPRWLVSGKTFKVITGAGNISAKIVANEKDLENIPSDLIVDVPIDYYDELKDNLLKNIKDILGRPTVRENKFITDITIIDRIFSNELVTNVEGVITADAGDKPEELIWGQLKDKFFIKTLDGKYKIRRACNELRYMGIDIAFSAQGDLMGFSVIHKEWSKEKNCVVYVSDLTFPLGPKEKGISLDAPVCFTLDMMKYASVMFHGIASDTFAAYAGQKQIFDRNNVKMITHTTDKDVSLYQYLYSCLNNDLIKSGRNIFLKNNLNSLVVTKSEKGRDKIDHIQGIRENKYIGDWDHSKCGINAKDVSDALAQAVYLAYSHDDYIPSTIYEEENRRLSQKKEDIEYNTREAFKKIHKYY